MITLPKRGVESILENQDILISLFSITERGDFCLSASKLVTRNTIYIFEKSQINISLQNPKDMCFIIILITLQVFGSEV